jgi:thiamine pyrophosphokinase
LARRPTRPSEPTSGVPDLDRPDTVVLAGGDPLPASLLDDVADALDHAGFTIAADGGLHHAHRADREVDVLVGDLDSVDPDALAQARRAGTDVRAHPADKDATDLELALDIVLERANGRANGQVDERADGRRGTGTDDPSHVLVIGGHGGRTDHLVANLLLLAASRFARLRLRAWWGADVVHIVRDSVTLTGEVGGRVSLLALHGPAEGVSTTGLRFPLTDAVLEAGSSLGMSNELSEPRATVDVRRGVLAVLQCPDA